MKHKIIIIIAVLFCSMSNYCQAQSINWAGLKEEHRHLVNLQLGIDYGVIYGLGYSYHLKSKLPLLLNAEFSIPSGNKFFDDFKTKIGAHAKLFKMNNIAVSLNINGIFRRYENTLVSLSNFGGSGNIIIGYYSPKWYVNGEFGFDRAIVTHFEHKDVYKSNFPDVKDGWYETTGGNVQFGMQIGYSFDQSDIYLKGGKTIAQDFKTSPTIPIYIQLGYNLKLK
ncbi:hypothetical protein [Flavobacterium aquicola]|uniref:Outer membrane protein with beta-barrel domain n=1 Tax=Flavobacterium aquicola TaxID=1682742 RepID=A0A3E0EMY0_9FLAO|nr:hypothetical protein [Flavobacterium aquicola]REG99465.1 hypothetical protein C8P67_10483 [Flavobacterium aquicola]